METERAEGSLARVDYVVITGYTFTEYGIRN